MGYGSRSAKGHQIPLLDEICAYLDDLFRPILEEEMGNMATYARRASVALASGASGHWEAFCLTGFMLKINGWRRESVT